jgi:hypothetical protein
MTIPTNIFHGGGSATRLPVFGLIGFCVQASNAGPKMGASSESSTVDGLPHRNDLNIHQGLKKYEVS